MHKEGKILLLAFLLLGVLFFYSKLHGTSEASVTGDFAVFKYVDFYSADTFLFHGYLLFGYYSRDTANKRDTCVTSPTTEPDISLKQSTTFTWYKSKWDQDADGQQHTYEDECIDAQQLNEYGCTRNAKIKVTDSGKTYDHLKGFFILTRVTCPQGCFNGACINDEGMCGNGVVDQGEECDGNDDSNCPGQCQSDCTCGSGSSTCGNGVIDSGEECDDGNTNNYDSCTNCKNAKCGDQYIQEVNNEECDDGSLANGDGCTSSCTFERPTPRTLATGDTIGDESFRNMYTSISSDNACVLFMRNYPTMTHIRSSPVCFDRVTIHSINLNNGQEYPLTGALTGECTENPDLGAARFTGPTFYERRKAMFARMWSEYHEYKSYIQCPVPFAIAEDCSASTALMPISCQQFGAPTSGEDVHDFRVSDDKTLFVYARAYNSCTQVGIKNDDTNIRAWSTKENDYNFYEITKFGSSPGESATTQDRWPVLRSDNTWIAFSRVRSISVNNHWVRDPTDYFNIWLVENKPFVSGENSKQLTNNDFDEVPVTWLDNQHLLIFRWDGSYFATDGKLIILNVDTLEEQIIGKGQIYQEDSYGVCGTSARELFYLPQIVFNKQFVLIQGSRNTFVLYDLQGKLYSITPQRGSQYVLMDNVYPEYHGLATSQDASLLSYVVYPADGTRRLDLLDLSKVKVPPIT